MTSTPSETGPPLPSTTAQPGVAAPAIGPSGAVRAEVGPRDPGGPGFGGAGGCSATAESTTHARNVDRVTTTAPVSEGEGHPGPLVLVLADSLAFHGPERGEPADDPRLWPNIAAARLGGRAELVAGYGWTARHAWRALTQDPRVWALMPRIDAVVLGVGGMDTLPSPLPTALRELIPMVRPPALRRAVRAGYLAAQPRLARALTRLPAGGPVALPPRLTVHHLESCRHAVTLIRPGLPVVAVVPSVHRADVYGFVHTGRPAAERATRRWAASHGVPILDLAEMVGDHIRSGEGNPDGIHWGWSGHRRVGEALGEVLAGMGLGARVCPETPGGGGAS